jgi:hypothetical protein
MVWGKCSYHYSFRQAEAEQWPADYSGAAGWYGGFIAWLRVDPEAAPAKAAGPAAFWGDPSTNSKYCAPAQNAPAGGE